MKQENWFNGTGNSDFPFDPHPHETPSEKPNKTNAAQKEGKKNKKNEFEQDQEQFYNIYSGTDLLRMFFS